MQNYKKILISTIIGHSLVHSITLIFPAIMIVLRAEYSASLIQLGELGTIQFLFFGLGAIPAGILVDKLGSKVVLVIYFAGLILSSALIITAHSFTHLAIGLGCLGLFAGLYHPAGLNLIRHTKNISQNMGYHGISGSLGLTIGPLIGGVMVAWFSWRFAYVTLALYSVIGGLYTLLQVPADTPDQTVTSGIKTRLTSKHAIIFAVSALWGFTHHGLFNFLPLYFTESVRWNMNPALIGGGLTAFVLLIGIVGQMAGGRIGALLPRNRLLVWVVGLNIPFLILMGYTAGIPLIIVAGILGAVNFTYQPVNNSLIADITPKANRGLVYGLSSGLGFGVGSFAASAGGYIGEIFQLSYIFPLLSIALLPAVVLSYLLHNER